jgi:hypothetical protein
MLTFSLITYAEFEGVFDKEKEGYLNSLDILIDPVKSAKSIRGKQTDLFNVSKQIGGIIGILFIVGIFAYLIVRLSKKR